MEETADQGSFTLTDLRLKVGGLILQMWELEKRLVIYEQQSGVITEQEKKEE
jgi:hypothetical protein